MSVHYKFKSALDYDTVTFDGLHISVGDLKAAISQQKRIGKTSDFDLQITNAQTKEVYVDDQTLIPKNTSLLVARVPLSQQPKKQWEGSGNNQSSLHKDVLVNKGLADLSRMEGSEQDKINAMISQSTFDYDPSNYQKIRGQNQRGAVPPNYICYKCQKRGHWIKDCPTANSGDPIEIRRSTGIPRSFMVPVEGPKAPGAMMTPSGTFAVPAVDHEAYLASENAGGGDTPANAAAAPDANIPDELICSLCRDLLTDAVMIPCCGNSFCDECIRGALLESEDHECPDCREKEIAPTTLIPNRFLRNSVSSFRNQTGYSRRTPHRPAAAPVQQIQPILDHPPPVVGGPPPPNGPSAAGGPSAAEESEGSGDDNITVRVPPAHKHTHGGLGGPGGPGARRGHAPHGPHANMHRHPRYGHPPVVKPPGMETPPSMPPMQRLDEQRASTPTIDERRDPQVIYSRGPPPFIPGMPPPPNRRYNDPPLGRPPGPPFGERFPSEPYQPPPPGIKDSPSNGPGEDPLEAFNRMIREKEMRAKRREEERRRAQSGSRSPRSPRSLRSVRSPHASRSPRPMPLARASRSPRPIRGSRSPRPIRASRSPRPIRASRSPRPIRASRSPRPIRASRSPRPIRSSRSPRPIRSSRSPRPIRSSRSPRPIRSSRSPRPLPRSPRSPRSPRGRPRSRASSRLRYSRSRSLSRGRLRRSSWSPRRRRSRERSLSLTRSPSPRRRHRSPMRFRSPLRSPVTRSPVRSLPRSPLRSPPRSPRRELIRSPPPRPLSPHRFSGVYDELLSPPRRNVEPPYGARYGPRGNIPPPIYPPLGVKPIPPLISVQTEPPPGYRGRYDGPPFEEIPPGVEPPVPGFEPSPFEKPPFGPGGPIDRDRLPPPNYRDAFRPAPYVDGPPVYRDMSIPPVSNEIPVHVGEPPRYRDNFRPGHSFRDAPVPFRDGQPYRDQVPSGPPYRDPNFRGGPPSFRDGSYRNIPYRDGSFRENAPHNNFRETSAPFRPPSADPRDPGPPGQPFRDPNYRDNFREENANVRDHARSGYRPGVRNRVGARRNPNVEHERHREREGRDRDRYSDNRDPAERADRSRDSERRSGRDERGRDYDKGREHERDRDLEKISPEKKARISPKRRDMREKKRSESRGRSRDRDRDRDNRKEKKEDRSYDKSSERNKEHKDKDKKIKDRKKKKREKEKDTEKKKKRDKKEKKDKEINIKKENEDNSMGNTKEKDEQVNEPEPKSDTKKQNEEVIKEDNIKTESLEKTANIYNNKDDLYGEETAETVDRATIENYVKLEQKNVPQDNTNNIFDTSEKEEPFDGLELQAAAEELELKVENEISQTNKEMLAPLPELSKWEVDEDNVEKAKEPGEITSPDEEEDGGKVTSDVIKRAENAIFAKAINSLRPIEIKKISSDRLKLYGDDATKSSMNNIQITVPITDSEHRSIEINEKKKRYSKTPPPKLSVKDRLGGKVEDTRKGREPRVVHSTVERVKSRSKTPKKDQPYRRVTVERDRDRNRKHGPVSRIESRPGKRIESGSIKNTDKQRGRSPKLAKKDFEKDYKDDKRAQVLESEGPRERPPDKNIPIELKTSNVDKERKKSTLDEAHFEPDYDETVESDNEMKEENLKKRERSASINGRDNNDLKKPKLEEETIKLDLTGVKKKRETESESSSDSEYSSSSSSSDARKRKKKKKRSKKKKKRAASDSDSESDSDSDDHKKKKKKRKHKKKASKKKKKSKHK